MKGRARESESDDDARAEGNPFLVSDWVGSISTASVGWEGGGDAESG